MPIHGVSCPNGIVTGFIRTIEQAYMATLRFNPHFPARLRSAYAERTAKGEAYRLREKERRSQQARNAANARCAKVKEQRQTA